jgi:putative methanogenesis marker protein 8
MGTIARVYEDGSIELLFEPPKELYCPYRRKVYGVKGNCREDVIKVLKLKMSLYGLFTPQRKLDFESRVIFGTSEIISWALGKGVFDCAVVVCEGAGTVITRNPALVQGIGAVMNGILKTYPIVEVIDGIKKRGGIILSEENATIDQVVGALKAIELGCRRIAVSVIGLRCWEIPELRKLEKKSNVDITVFCTCNTLTKRDCFEYIEKADYVCTSANTELRKALAGKALLQLGVTIPVYILTEKTRDIVFEYLKALKEQILIRRATLPYEDVDTAKCTSCEWL